METTFPVAEATSSGILIIAGQMLLFLVTFLMQFVEQLDWIYWQGHRGAGGELPA